MENTGSSPSPVITDNVLAAFARRFEYLPQHQQVRLLELAEQYHANNQRGQEQTKAACGAQGNNETNWRSDVQRTSEELSLDNIEDAMRYQGWNPTQLAAGDQVRETLVLAAKAILRNAPRSPRRTLALQHLISARMDANAAISFGGRF